MKSLHLESRREGSVLIVVLRGRLDGNSSQDFEKFMTQETGGESAEVVLDAGELVFLSSAGLRELMLLARRLGRHGAKVSIYRARTMIRETLEMTGIDTLFHFADDLALAKKAVGGGRSRGAGFLESWFQRKT